jgi:hypothetical protein
MGRNIGIEIEINKQRRNRRALQARSLKTAVANALSDVGAPARYLNPREVGWYKSDGNTWDVKTDATSGWEVASRALQLNAEGQNEELERVCHHFAALDPVVNNSCGLHMHIETRDLSWAQVQNLVWLWARYEPFWFSLVPPYRRARSYCAPLCTYELDGQPSFHWTNVHRMITGARDHANPDNWPRIALNLRPWWHSGRIEVRLHHGTISYQEMREWAMLMLSLVERAKTNVALEPYVPRQRMRAIDTEYVGAVLGLREPHAHPVTRDLMQWIENRRIAWNPELESRRLDLDPLARIRTLAHAPASRMPSAAAQRLRGQVNPLVITQDQTVTAVEQQRIELLRANRRAARGRVR